MKDGADRLPDWLQPTGIFKDGKSFNALIFLQTVHDIYDTVTLSGRGPDESRAMEQAVFARMLEERLVIIPNGVLFRLFSEAQPTPTYLIRKVVTLTIFVLIAAPSCCRLQLSNTFGYGTNKLC